MQGTLEIILQLICGAIGGNVAGAAKKDWSLGTIGNSIVGILGGGLGAQLLGMLGLGATPAGTNLESVISSIVGGGVGGAVLMAIVGLIKQAMTKKASA